MLAINEDLCDMERVRDFTPDLPPSCAPSPSRSSTRSSSPRPGSFWSLLEAGGGVWGAPSESTAEKGEEFLAWCATAVVNLVRDMEDVHDRLEPSYSAERRRSRSRCRSLTSTGRRVYYEAHGEGDPVLLVTGLGADAPRLGPADGRIPRRTA